MNAVQLLITWMKQLKSDAADSKSRYSLSSIGNGSTLPGYHILKNAYRRKFRAFYTFYTLTLTFSVFHIYRNVKEVHTRHFPPGHFAKLYYIRHSNNMALGDWRSSDKFTM